LTSRTTMDINALLLTFFVLLTVHDSFRVNLRVSRGLQLFSTQKKIRSIERTIKNIAHQVEMFANETKTAAAISAEEDSNLRKALNELIGYNQNQDKNVEHAIGCSLKGYLKQVLMLPDTCIMEVEEHRIFDPKSGETACEWDEIVVINYTELPHDVVQAKEWPVNGTVFVMEVKQMVNTTTVLSKIPQKLVRTDKVLRSTSRPRRRFQSKIAAQRASFPQDPLFIVALGGSNVHGTVQQDIVDSGYLAISPSGDDFKVVHSSYHSVKVFNATSLYEIIPE
jgi:hypothetical protein